jgi:hypothetical protein
MQEKRKFRLRCLLTVNVEQFVREKVRYLVWNLEGKEAKVFQLTFAEHSICYSFNE